MAGKRKSDAESGERKLRLLMPEAFILPAFDVWILTQYQVLPDSGGWFDQDPAVCHDFHELLLEFNELQTSPPVVDEDIDSLPSMSDF